MTPELLNNHIIEYCKALENGEITKEEYVELLKGINVMEGIADDAEGLALKEQLNVIINAAISAASLMTQEKNMLDTLFWIAVGAFVGWHFPEPFWAKAIKAKVLGMIKK